MGKHDVGTENSYNLGIGIPIWGEVLAPVLCNVTIVLQLPMSGPFCCYSKVIPGGSLPGGFTVSCSTPFFLNQAVPPRLFNVGRADQIEDL